MNWHPHPLDHESRALWHLELLGCYEPADAIAPWVPPVFDGDLDGEWDDDDGFSCTHCGGEAYVQVEDPFWDECDQFGWGPCTSCRGTGERRHQWVF